jgi:hypothetical protein
MVAAVATDEPQMAPPAAQVADEGVSRAEQFLRHPGPRDEVTHQNKKRDHRQGVIPPGLVDLGLDHCHGWREIPVAQIRDTEKADHSHGNGDRDAQERKHHHES